MFSFLIHHFWESEAAFDYRIRFILFFSLYPYAMDVSFYSPHRSDLSLVEGVNARTQGSAFNFRGLSSSRFLRAVSVESKEVID